MIFKRARITFFGIVIVLLVLVALYWVFFSNFLQDPLGALSNLTGVSLGGKSSQKLATTTGHMRSNLRFSAVRSKLRTTGGMLALRARVARR